MTNPIYDHSLRMAFDPYYSSLAGSFAVQIPIQHTTNIDLSTGGKVTAVFKGEASGNGGQSRHHHGADAQKKDMLLYRKKKKGSGIETVPQSDGQSRISIRV